MKHFASESAYLEASRWSPTRQIRLPEQELFASISSRLLACSTLYRIRYSEDAESVLHYRWIVKCYSLAFAHVIQCFGLVFALLDSKAACKPYIEPSCRSLVGSSP